MNHLGCDASMRVVFDAGDAKLEDDEDKEAQEEEEEEEEYTKLDISKLRSMFSSSPLCLFLLSELNIASR